MNLRQRIRTRTAEAEDQMAHKTTETHHISPTMDYKAHEATYNGFIRLLKWSIAATAVFVVLLYFIVQP